jgi:hypothetical protein
MEIKPQLPGKIRQKNLIMLVGTRLAKVEKMLLTGAIGNSRNSNLT